MRKLIETFPAQIKKSLKDGKIAGRIQKDGGINAVVVCGMGGSGIGGKVVSEWLSAEIEVPFICHNAYGLPNFCDQHTLVIISSYSGNTEETLTALESALAKGCPVACITSGGRVKEIAQKYDLPYVEINGGFPPRSQFGQSTVQLCRLLENYNLIPTSVYENLKMAAELLENSQKHMEKEAYSVATQINNTTPIVYASSDYEGVAIRWRQQIAENSKMMVWHHHFPEMNHNELVGWEGGSDRYSAVILRNEDDAQRVKVRMDICDTIFQSKGAGVIDVNSKGKSRLERSLYLIHFGDWVSLHLAEINDTDPVDIENIDLLKNKLSKVQ